MDISYFLSFLLSFSINERNETNIEMVNANVFMSYEEKILENKHATIEDNVESKLERIIFERTYTHLFC